MAQPLDDRRKYWEWQRGQAVADGGGDLAAAAAATRYVAPVLLGLLVVIGAVGNGAILYVVCRYRRMKTAPNAFLAHVALADLLALFAVAPFVAAYYATGDWPAGVVTCKLAEGAQTLAMALSALSVVALSIERYAAFAIPPRRRRGVDGVVGARRRGACAGLFVIWTLALAAAAPDAASSHIERRGDGTQHCAPFTDAWGHMYPRIHTVVSLCSLLALPLVLVAIFYASLGCVVCGRKRLRRRARASGRRTTNGGRAAAGPPSAATAAAAVYGSLRNNGVLAGSAHGPHYSSNEHRGSTDGWDRHLSYGCVKQNGGLSNGRGDSNGWGLTKPAAAAGDRRTASHDRLAAPAESRNGCGNGKQREKAASPSPRRDWNAECADRLAQRRRTLAKVATLLCIQFAAFWAPKYAYRAWVYFSDPEGGDAADERVWQYVRLAGVGGVFVNAALAPFTVVALNSNFRRYLKKYLCCCCSCSACCCPDDDGGRSSASADSSTLSGTAGCAAAATACCCARSRGGGGGDGVEREVGVDDYRGDANGAAVPSRRRSEQLPLATMAVGYAYPDAGQRGLPHAGGGGGRGADALYGTGMLTDVAHLRRPATGDYSQLFVCPAQLRQGGGDGATSPYYAQLAEQPIYVVDLDGRPFAVAPNTFGTAQRLQLDGRATFRASLPATPLAADDPRFSRGAFVAGAPPSAEAGAEASSPAAAAAAATAAAMAAAGVIVIEPEEVSEGAAPGVYI